MQLEKITIQASSKTGYGLWNSDDNVLIGVIVKKPFEGDGENIDVTETIRTMIREHENAYRVDISIIEGDDVLQPGEFGKCEIYASVFQSNEEDAESDMRTYEIQSVSVY